MKQTEHYHTFQSEGTTNKPEVNKHKTKFNFPKTRLLLSEHLTSGAQTLVFGNSNNIVSRYKHTFFALIWNIHARRPAWIFLKKPTLSDFSKVRVS